MRALRAALFSDEFSLARPERGQRVVIALHSILAPVTPVAGKLRVAAPPQGLVTLSHLS